MVFPAWLTVRLRSTEAPPERNSKFLLHYYGPFETAKKQRTYRYVAATDVIVAARGRAEAVGLKPEIFRDKIVLIGGTAANLQDEKFMPLSEAYPGVEWQATAIDNLIRGDRVRVIPRTVAIGLTFVASLMAAGGTLIPRRVWVKLTAATVVTLCVVAVAVFLFQGTPIRFVHLSTPLFALLLSTVAAFAWSYFTEGRQRLFFSNAFALSTSPVIAAAIDRNPDKLTLGGERREITVMFTDLAGFTDFAETMEVEKLVRVINLYMEAMSEEIVNQDGYLDKYIGDAIMSSWNGLLEQPDHAAQACRAALGIKRREVQIAPQMRELTEAKIITRIGIHAGPMAVGNLGSSRKLSYTVLGDAVNLAARLEPANKLYGTEVLISQPIAEGVKGRFVIRELDLLRVKGKQRPMAVFELMGEGEPTPGQQQRMDLYAQGLAHYRAQRWDAAEASLRDLLKVFPDDGPATSLLTRVGKLRNDPPAADWDGVYVAKEK